MEGSLVHVSGVLLLLIACGYYLVAMAITNYRDILSPQW